MTLTTSYELSKQLGGLKSCRMEGCTEVVHHEDSPTTSTTKKSVPFYSIYW